MIYSWGKGKKCAHQRIILFQKVSMKMDKKKSHK